MTKDSFRLVAYGFVKKDYKDDFKNGNLSIEVEGKKYKIEGKDPLAKIESIKKLKKELELR